MTQPRRQLELLRQYAEGNDQDAFRQIVAEHIDMVYSACARQLGDPHMAEEVTQAVFIILAKKAAMLPETTILPAWLHKTARYAALNAMKMERRRRIHERRAAEMAMERSRNSGSWVKLAPVLDEGMARLADRDRAAIMLRFFEKRSIADVGAAMGVSEDAAGMRISRALDKLRSFFSRRGVAVSTAAVGALMLRNGVEAAPLALASSIGGSVVGSGIGVGAMMGGPLVKGALKMMFWQKVKIAAAIVITTMSAACGGTYLFHYLLTHASQREEMPRQVQVETRDASV